MACIRGCSGTPLCTSLELCCMQFQHDCGRDCDGVAEGYSIIQINVDGELEVCSNVGGVCTCELVGSSLVSVITLPGNGTIVHTGGDGTETIIDICDLLSEAYDLTPWTALPLSAGWVAEAGMQAPEYRCLCDGTVQLRGCVSHDDADGNNDVPESVATLPASQNGNSCRPTATERFWAGGHCAALEIAPDGTIVTNPSLPPSTRCFGGVQFYV